MQKSTKDLADKKSVVTDSKTAEIKASAKKASSVAKKSTAKATKKTTTAKKTTASKSTKKATTKKVATSVASKKTAAKKAATSKSAKSAKKSATSKKAKKVEVLEYYDLPYRYNQTVVKILAQTPNTLFVYWDISDIDRKKYIEEFGEDFFQSTVPVLIVHNKTMNYSFEIEINDFANSWYFDINDTKCDYEIELGRRARPATPISLPNNYMYVASSNTIETPNNHILFEKNQKVLFFKNVKNNTRVSKDISNFEFMNYIGRVYNIYDVYKKIYKDEELQDLEKLPSSNF